MVADGLVINGFFPERDFQLEKRKLLEGATQGRRKKKKKPLFNEDLLHQWEDWERDNNVADETTKDDDKEKGPGLEPIHKKSSGANRVRAIISERGAQKMTNMALDQAAERARRDLLENQWRPY